ncbi:hypothetical protein M9Y10_043106 [Tritrichomonas musculus]|uniref:Uncharacterized protein n=1 Tax=Tritrichomonas musculus TaxID=1915356 RepID=A0ABR2JYV0_9EUKA
MSDSELDGFPVLNSTELGSMPSVNFDPNSQFPSVKAEVQSNHSGSGENLNTQESSSDKLNKPASPQLIPPSSINLPSSPNISNQDFDVAQPESSSISNSQGIRRLDVNSSNGNENYSQTIGSPLLDVTNQIDYRSLDEQAEEESCRKTCLKIFCGIFCNFEDTVYTYTQPLNIEVDKMNHQIHHCLDTIFHNLCGCSEQ